MSTKKQTKPIHHASDYGLDVTTGDTDLFQWFLLCYLFGKPIQSTVAVYTWKLLIGAQLDTPWTIVDADHRLLIGLLYEGKYTRYAESTARGLKECMSQLIRDYEGSLLLMFEYSEDEEQFGKRLQKLYGIGPKVAEIFMRETEELFARRVE
jgi:3-methyladenine DNA glycosylase/8-oxoguanine DNA glycosylase